MTRVFVGIGSNLDNPLEQVKRALHALDTLNNVKRGVISSLYASAPMGPQDQPDYINAVVELETELPAGVLLDELQAIENQQGRVRNRHWGERTLDLDILLYGNKTIKDERLQIPHPGIAERAFVLYPLFEIAPELKIANMGAIKNLLLSCERGSLRRLEEVKV